MPLTRLLSISLLSFLLTACGGGGSIEKDGTVGGDTGTDTDVSTSITMELTLVDQSGLVFTDSNPVSKDNKGVVTATLTSDGEPLTSQLVTFTTEFTGKITPELGTALTNETGQAVVSLSSGDFKGAGEITATYIGDDSTVTKTLGFISNGDDASTEEAVVDVDIKLLQGCADGWDNDRNLVSLEQTYSASGCTVVNQFSSDELIDVLVKVTDTSSGDGFVGIISEISTDLGSLLPVSGKALTDNFGFAILKLQPGANSGAGEITATSKLTSSQKAFEISTAELQVNISNGLFNVLDANGNPIAGVYQPLAAGATTVITVEILDSNSELVVSALDVEFTSNCTQAGLSVMDATAKSISGIATATYRTDGCSASLGDTVTATVLTGGTPVIKSINIPVSIAEVESIEFIDATQNVIALKGTGGQTRSETSEVTFKLKDKIGKSVVSSRMDFRLSSTNGGISLSHPSVFTDAEGLARVQINAGFVPMAVRVQACYIPDDQIPENQNDDVTCWQDIYLECQKDATDRSDNVSCPVGELSLVSLDEQVITVSDLVSISSGLPDGNSFTAAPTNFNIETLIYDGDIENINVYLADHFNNPVPDGTSVYLTTEGGAIGTIDGTEFNPQLECNTVDGQCIAQWRSQNPKPFTEAKWGNRIYSINPKTDLINCDLYFGSAAPCMAGILNAAINENGVPLGGRATVLVTAKGQESFIDINGNGLFDTNEYYSGYDLPEAFVDHNENGFYDGLAGIYDPVTATVTEDASFCQEGSLTDPCSPKNTNGGHFEESFDIDQNGMHTLADGKYNGLVCKAEATTPTEGDTFESLCTKELVDIRDSFEIIMSGSTAYSRFVVSKGELFNRFAEALSETTENNPNVLTDNAIQLAQDIVECNQIRRFPAAEDIFKGVLVLDLEETADANYCDVRDINITTADSGVELAGLTFDVYYSDVYNNPMPAGTTVVISSENGEYSGTDGFVLPNSSSTFAAGETLTITRETEGNDKTEGLLTVEFTTGKGNISTAQISISDDD